MNEENELKDKKVDEGWKENVEKEKVEEPQDDQKASQAPQIEASFPIFVSGIAMQALMALGRIPDPRTGSTEKDLGQAKYLIDIVDILKEKTMGNLGDDESKLLDDVLYDLRIHFVEASKEKNDQEKTKDEKES